MTCLKAAIISGLLIILSGCAASQPIQAKVKINPPLLAEFTIEELQETPDSVVEKIGLYVADVVGYIRKVNALPCVDRGGRD
jgi:hypothetical protein